MTACNRVQVEVAHDARAEIVVGDLFSWGHRPVMEFRGVVPGGLTIRDGYISCGRKPSKWWHARAWYRVMRQLWRLP